MSSLMKTVFGSPQSPSSMGARSPSFNDLSMGAHDDVHEEYTFEHPEAEPNSPTSPDTPSRKKNPWASTFNPGRNMHGNMKGVGNTYYDHVEKAPGGSSIWDHIIKSERQKAFNSFDRDHDGFITAEDLKVKLGGQADVGQLIAAADKNGDGKIDYQEFVELVRNS